MKKTLIALATTAIIALTSCGGFETTEGGVKYKFIEQNKDGKKPAEGDVISLNMKLITADDSTLLNTDDLKDRLPGGKYKMLLSKPKYKGDPFEALLLMSVGDSAIIKCSANDFFANYFKGAPIDSAWKDTELTLYTRITATQTIDEAKAEDAKYFESRNRADATKEKEELNKYLGANNITQGALPSGLIFIEKKAGTGKKAEGGKYVTVNYTGRLLNGKVFDSSEGKPPFEFQLGARMVIPAWDEGIALLKEGGQAQLICPSAIAYGERGAGADIPPFSPLVFDVELVKVSDKPTQPQP